MSNHWLRNGVTGFGALEREVRPSSWDSGLSVTPPRALRLPAGQQE
ncbi:hypothetical protein [Streptomyces solicathayae]|uniref:Uncharacterized protein n=1 Tax=Streptomyces solicathayae TaxID=3081768 RepID=A0ABZ0LKJ2_9ACTN|nr:hypothetical protein [Streptomyces sp. HUAS YS2]WOX19951.1 hypothetical protein R2D22_00450 [Streptomyces sp. HUAS YS2]